MDNTIRKNLDISKEAVKELAIKAIEAGYRDFKNYAQHIIEMEAKRVREMRLKRRKQTA